MLRLSMSGLVSFNSSPYSCQDGRLLMVNQPLFQFMDVALPGWFCTGLALIAVLWRQKVLGNVLSGFGNVASSCGRGGERSSERAGWAIKPKVAFSCVISSHVPVPSVLLAVPGPKDHLFVDPMV